MKKILLAGALLLGTHVANSQILIALVFGDKIKTDKLEMGIQLSAQGSRLSGISNDAQVGFSFGAYADWKFSDKFSSSNYFMFKSPKGGKNLDADNLFSQIDPDSASMKRHISYFELTPMFRYNISRSLSVAIGPQIALRSKAKDIYQKDTDEGEVTYRQNIKDNIALMDAGIAVDLQWRLMHGKGMRINLRFAQGLINTYKDGVFNAKNQTLQAGVGIPLGQKPRKTEKETKQ